MSERRVRSSSLKSKQRIYDIFQLRLMNSTATMRKEML